MISICVAYYSYLIILFNFQTMGDTMTKCCGSSSDGKTPSGTKPSNEDKH